MNRIHIDRYVVKPWEPGDDPARGRWLAYAYFYPDGVRRLPAIYYRLSDAMQAARTRGTGRFDMATWWEAAEHGARVERVTLVSESTTSEPTTSEPMLPTP